MTTLTPLKPKNPLLASIDLGTNTCLLLITRWDPIQKKLLKPQVDVATVVRLGEGVSQTKHFHPQAEARTLECLKNYQAILSQFDLFPSSVYCVATSQAREVTQAAAFFKKIQATLGFDFHILTGEEEAKLTFIGTLSDLPHSSYQVLDIGGGSTEWISPSNPLSLNLGCVRLTEQFLQPLPPSNQQLKACQAWIDSEWNQARHSGFLDPASFSLPLVAVAGTAVALATWQLGLRSFQPHRVHKARLTLEQIQQHIQTLKNLTPQACSELTGLELNRADVLLAGALILHQSLAFLGKNDCQISTRGLRYGVFPELQQLKSLP